MLHRKLATFSLCTKYNIELYISTFIGIQNHFIGIQNHFKEVKQEQEIKHKMHKIETPYKKC